MSRIIWIINHYASHLPVRHTELARCFAAKGCRVLVITSSFHHGNHHYLYSDEIKIIENCTNVKTVYLHSQPAYTNNGVKRVLNMFGFCALFRKYRDKLCQIYGKPDDIIGSSLHPLAWEISYSAAQKYNAKFIAEFRDIWPLQLTAIMGMPKYHPVVVFFDQICKRAYRRADAIVSTMPYAYRYVCDELGFPREKVHWMPNGINIKEIDAYLDDPSSQLPGELDEYLTRHWCCIFTGSLVVSERVPFLIEAFTHLKEYPDIHFAIVGEGHSRQQVIEAIQQYGLEEKVRVFPKISSMQVHLALRKGKAAVAAVYDNGPLYKYGLSMLKLSDYLYSGIPTIFACDVENVVQNAGGICISFGDSQNFADQILKVYRMSSEQVKEMGNRQRAEIINNYDYAKIADDYLKLMERIK